MSFLRVLLLALGITVFGACGVFAEGVVHEPLGIDRYEAIWKRSPFTLATVQAVEQRLGTWVLVGLSGNAEEPVAILYNRETQERRMVTKVPDEAGLSVIEAVFAGDLLECRVRVQTRSEIIEARFDKQLLESQLAAVQTSAQQVPAANRVQPRTAPGRPVNAPKRIVIPAPRP